MNARELEWVAVEWVDSVSLSGWRPVHAVDELVDEPDALDQLTVGLLYAERDDRIVVLLCAGLGREPELGEAMAIPRPAIKRVHKLKRPPVK